MEQPSEFLSSLSIFSGEFPIPTTTTTTTLLQGKRSILRPNWSINFTNSQSLIITRHIANDKMRKNSIFSVILRFTRYNEHRVWHPTPDCTAQNWRRRWRLLRTIPPSVMISSPDKPFVSQRSRVPSTVILLRMTTKPKEQGSSCWSNTRRR